MTNIDIALHRRLEAAATAESRPPMRANPCVVVRRTGIEGETENATVWLVCDVTGRLVAEFRSEKDARHFLALRNDHVAMLDEIQSARLWRGALEELLVEATMEPFDIGPCYIAGPLEMANEHRGELMPVRTEVMQGVFETLLVRLKSLLPNAVERENRRCNELDALRAVAADMEAISHVEPDRLDHSRDVAIIQRIKATAKRSLARWEATKQ